MPGWNPIHGFDSGPPPPRANPNPNARPAHPVIQLVAPQPRWVFTAYGWQLQPVPQQYIVQPQPLPVFIQQPQPQPIHIQQPPPQHIYVNQPTTQGGLSPGYDAFPQECCKVHVILSNIPPWDPTFGAFQHTKNMIPIHTKMSDVMKKYGCTNADPAKNILYEMTEAGNGRWLTGLIFKVSEQ